MTRTVTLWMLVGLTVACCWVLISLLIGPTSYNLGRSDLVAITAPATFVGRRMPLGMVSFVLLNGVFYAVLGFAIELVRRSRLN